MQAGGHRFDPGQLHQALAFARNHPRKEWSGIHVALLTRSSRGSTAHTKELIRPDVEVRSVLFENLGRNKRLALAELDVSLRQLGEILSVDRLGGDFELYDQANKRLRWMPWQSEAMKDVTACEKLRGAGNMH